jgi:hypothetical protein
VPPGALFVGDAAVKHRAAIEGAGFGLALDEVGEATGDGLLAFLKLRPDTQALAAPGAWEPQYLKASSAERAWIA